MSKKDRLIFLFHGTIDLLEVLELRFFHTVLWFVGRFSHKFLLRLRQARDEVARYKAKLDRVGNYEREVRKLRDEVSLLLTEKELLEAR